MGSMCRSSFLKILLFKELSIFRLSSYFCKYFVLITRGITNSIVVPMMSILMPERQRSVHFSERARLLNSLQVKHYHNVIYILRKGGMTQQEALDHVGEAVLARYLEWDLVVERVPSWGAKVDAIVKRYIEISKISVISNLHWR